MPTYLLLRTVGQWYVGISTDVYLGRTVGSPWNVRCRHSKGSHSRSGDIPQEWISTYHVYHLHQGGVDEYEEPLAVHIHHQPVRHYGALVVLDSHSRHGARLPPEVDDAMVCSSMCLHLGAVNM